MKFKYIILIFLLDLIEIPNVRGEHSKFRDFFCHHAPKTIGDSGSLEAEKADPVVSLMNTSVLQKPTRKMHTNGTKMQSNVIKKPFNLENMQLNAAKMPPSKMAKKAGKWRQIFNVLKSPFTHGKKSIITPMNIDGKAVITGLGIISQLGTSCLAGTSICKKKIVQIVVNEGSDDEHEQLLRLPAAALIGEAVEEVGKKRNQKRIRIQNEEDGNMKKGRMQIDEPNGMAQIEGMPMEIDEEQDKRKSKIIGRGGERKKRIRSEEEEENKRNKEKKRPRITENKGKFENSKMKKVLIRENKAREREEEIEQIQQLLLKLEKEENEEKEAQLKQEEEQLKKDYEAEIDKLFKEQAYAEAEAREEMARKSESELAALCHPDVIKQLGHNGMDGNGETSDDEKVEEVNKDNPQNELDFRGAIRLALRQFFCEGAEWKQMPSNKGNVDGIERLFKKEDPTYPHTYKNDFKFTFFFPEKFEQLWKIYNADERDLLASLTKMNLKGFKNPAQSGSWMANSWDGKYFLKTVKTVPKAGILEDTLEKDFFFQMISEGNKFTYKSWPKSNGSKYKGGWEKYYENMLEFKQETLLPKFFMFFSIEEAGKIPTLVTIQNCLFPNVVPEIHYKFDLKGSTKNRLLTEADLIDLEEDREPTWMDQNFIRHGKQPEPSGFFRSGIQIDESEWQRLKTIIDRDSKLLKEMNIVDYSLLLGVHFVDPMDPQVIEQGYSATCINCEELDPNMPRAEMAKFLPQKINLEPKEENAESDDEMMSSPLLRITSERRDLRIFIGIIDILQDYNTLKYFETGVKTVKNFFDNSEKKIVSVFPKNGNYKHSPTTIIAPDEYQKRFVNFLTEVVFPNKTKEEEEEEEVKGK